MSSSAENSTQPASLKVTGTCVYSEIERLQLRHKYDVIRTSVWQKLHSGSNYGSLPEVVAASVLRVADVLHVSSEVPVSKRRMAY